MMTPEEVAAGIADAAEAATLPLRIPPGRAAAEILAVRRSAPDDRPFIPGAPAGARSSAQLGRERLGKVSAIVSREE
jgi:hypothetical protein